MNIYIPYNVDTSAIENDLNRWIKITKDYPYEHIVQQRVNSLFPRLCLDTHTITIHLENGVFRVPTVHIVNKFCAICHASNTETFDKLDCGHEFHINCLNKWLKLKNTCPMCRTIV